MTAKKLSRRDMLKLTGTLATGTLLAACATPTAQIIKETVEVQVPVEKTVKETVIVTEKETVKETVVVEPTAAPAVVKPVEGKVVVMHYLHEFTVDHAKAFMDANPGITVEIVDGSDMNRLFAMLAAGAPPDMVRVQAPSIPQFLARKLLYDLTPYFQTSELLKMDDLMPANNYYKARSALEIGEGPIYGMVKDFSPDLTIFANTKLLGDAGVTVDDTKALTMQEVFDIARKTTIFEGDRVINEGYGYEGGWIDRFIMVGLAETNLSLYSQVYDKLVIKGNDTAIGMCKTFFDMCKEKVVASPINPSPNGWFGTDYNANILAMAQYGFWFSAMAETDQNRGNCAMLPAPTWSGVRMDPTVTSTGMIMISQTQVPDAAWKVFEYYNGGAPSVERAKSGWGVPGLRSQLELIPQGTDFQKQAYRVLQGELALNTPPLQFNPFIGESTFATSWNKNLDQALKDEITFDEMIANIEAEVNLAIQEGIDRLS